MIYGGASRLLTESVETTLAYFGERFEFSELQSIDLSSLTQAQQQASSLAQTSLAKRKLILFAQNTK
jgi:hypothetical protein